MPRLGRQIGVPGLLMKDEGPLPTATFKARGAAVGVSRAAELGAAGVAMPTNGNAGAAWAAFCARAGLPFLVAMPADAPQITRSECVATGAQTYVVDGLIGDARPDAGACRRQRRGLAGRLHAEGAVPAGGQEDDRPGDSRAAGLAGSGRDPLPVGGGVGLIGIWKALQELAELGWIGPSMPRLVAVQAAGCAPIVSAFERGEASHVAVARCAYRRVRPDGAGAARRLPGAAGGAGDRRLRRSPSPTPALLAAQARRPAPRGRGSARRVRPASPRRPSCASPAGWPSATRSSCLTPEPG